MNHEPYRLWRASSPVFDAMPEGVVVIDCSQRIQVFNRQAARLLAVEPEEALDQPISRIIPNTRLPKVLHSQTAELNQRQVLGERTILTNRIPVFHPDRTLLGVLAVFQDNSEVLRLAEEITNLKETRSLLEAIINSTQDAISVVNEDGVGILINPAYTRLTGLTEDDVLGKPATVDIAEGESVHLRVLSSKAPVTGVSMKVGPKRKPVVVDGAPILVEGRLKGSVGVIHDLSEIYRLAEELEQARQRIRTLEAKYQFEDIVGSSPQLESALAQAKKAATTPATILLQGESGTGKELFAHAIHHASGRKGQFVRVSCAAMADSLLESELFGYAPGAFTGADKKGRKGYFETAHKGTLFLDEIGEVSLSLQAKLLRVLQEKEIVRVGDSRPIPVDTRLIAATNKNLAQEVEAGRFRQDLFYRLHVVPIAIPPLRRRKEDIPRLAELLLRKINQEYGRNIHGLDPSVLDILQAYGWPGNVRELENVLRRAAITLNIADTTVLPEHLPRLHPEPSSPGQEEICEPSPGEPWPDKTLNQMRQDWERRTIDLALEKTGGNRARAADLLGISLRNLYHKLRKHRLA